LIELIDTDVQSLRQFGQLRWIHNGVRQPYRTWCSNKLWNL